MSIEENKNLVRRFYDEVINQKNLDLADEFVVEGAIENEEVNMSGLESLKQFYRNFYAAFPDLHFHIEDMIAEDDKVVVRMTVTGAHTGETEFMGFTPSGNKMKVETIDIIRFEDGMMVEHWGRTDTLGMIQQLGETPNESLINSIRVDP